MTVMLDAKLGTLIFRPDPEPHIVVQKELCLVCDGRPCIPVCPAGSYVWETNQMVFNCDGCLECGACRAVCPQGAVTWRFPRGGYGVRYLWG